MRRRQTVLPYADVRHVRFYNPFRDAAQRYPDWRIRCADLGGRCSEVILTVERTILVDPRHWDGDEPTAIAHAISHLDLHRRKLERLTLRHENEADRLAHLRLDQLAALV